MLICFGLLPANVARAEAPYAKLAQMQAVFDAIPAEQRDKLILRQSMAHEDATDHSPIQMWVTDNAKRVDIPVAADGTITLGRHPDWIADGRLVHTNQPAGQHLKLSLDIQIAPPPTPAIPATYLLAAMDQAQSAIKLGARAAGGYLASLAAPSVHGVIVKLARCCNETLKTNFPLPAQSATGEIALSRELLDQNQTATLTPTAPIISITADAD